MFECQREIKNIEASEGADVPVVGSVQMRESKTFFQFRLKHDSCRNRRSNIWGREFA